MQTLFEINTRVWLNEIERRTGSSRLDSVPESELQAIQDSGFDQVWLMGVWQTGSAGRMISRTRDDWRGELLESLEDLRLEDISGSPYAVKDYTVHADFGGNEALLHFRERLHKRGIKLLLDLVPNHTAIDHRWAWSNPEFYVHGDTLDFLREPNNFIEVQTSAGSRIIAHGRDPYFPGWPDTLQLNYCSPGLRQAMLQEIKKISDLCDGVRCDMAMLLLPDVIQRTWGDLSKPIDGSTPSTRCFWEDAIPQIKKAHKDFIFMAEVYWDLEWDLQQLGFNYTYDKRLYDRLKQTDIPGVRGHLKADLAFQSKLVRFLENHDEQRARATFPDAMHKAAAIITFSIPGLRFFYEGQLDGRRKRASVHLGRRAVEELSPDIRSFYDLLLKKLPDNNGDFVVLEPRSAWEGNATNSNYICHSWFAAKTPQMVIAVNYSPVQSQCYVTLPTKILEGKKIKLRDRLSTTVYERSGSDLCNGGLYLDLKPWQYHIFDIEIA